LSHHYYIQRGITHRIQDRDAGKKIASARLAHHIRIGEAGAQIYREKQEPYGNKEEKATPFSFSP